MKYRIVKKGSKWLVIVIDGDGKEVSKKECKTRGDAMKARDKAHAEA